MLQDWLAVTWEVSNMIKKRTHSICCAMFLAVACVGLVACGGGDSSGVSKKSTIGQNGLPKKNYRKKDLPA